MSSQVYTIDKLREILTALREEARDILLFLRSVTVVEVHEISDGGDCTELLRVSSVFEGSQLQLRSEFHQQLRAAFERFSYDIVHPIERTVQFKVNVEDFIDPVNSSESEWLVASRVGSPSSEVHRIAKALMALPWVGVALETTESTAIGGRVFCVLPMPSEVSCHLPVHVNATFSLNDERRELKWAGVERKNDPSADWNGLIIEHLLPPCYAGLLLGHVKELFTGYRAWPDIHKLRRTHWEVILKALFEELFSGSVFFSSCGGWVNHKDTLFTPMELDKKPPSVVNTVLTACGEKIVTIPPQVWDALGYMSISVATITPNHTRLKLKDNQGVYTRYSHQENFKLLQYCLSDGIFNDLTGIELLPLANNTYTVFNKRNSSPTVYLCSAEYQSCLIPGCKDQLVDTWEKDEELHHLLTRVAECEYTQIKLLDASSVADLLRKCLPTSAAITLPHTSICREWLQLFWKWAVHQETLKTFSRLLVVPVYDPSSQVEGVESLTTESAAVFSEGYIDDTLSAVLAKYHVRYCEQMRFPFVCTLKSPLFKDLSSGGILDSIYQANQYSNVELTSLEATYFRKCLYEYSTTSERNNILRQLALFTAIDGELYPVGQIHSPQIEPQNFTLSTQYLPSQLILFSNSELCQMSLLKTLSVPQPTTAAFLVDSVFSVIGSRQIPLMKEVLESFDFICSTVTCTEQSKK